MVQGCQIRCLTTDLVLFDAKILGYRRIFYGTKNHLKNQLLAKFWAIKYKNLIPSINDGTRKKLANKAKNFPGL